MARVLKFINHVFSIHLSFWSLGSSLTYLVSLSTAMELLLDCLAQISHESIGSFFPHLAGRYWGKTNLKTVNYNVFPDASRFTINHLAIYLTILHNLPSWARIFKLYIKAVLARSKKRVLSRKLLLVIEALLKHLRQCLKLSSLAFTLNLVLFVKACNLPFLLVPGLITLISVLNNRFSLTQLLQSFP